MIFNSKKAILMYPFAQNDSEKLNIGQSIYLNLISCGYDVKKLSLYNDDGSYKESVKEAFDLTQSGFDAQFILISDYGPWPGAGWKKQNFPNTMLVYEAGDEPQSMYSHMFKIMNADLVLTPDARNASIYKDAFKKACLWWPQFAMKSVYDRNFNVKPESICVTSCGEDRGPTTHHMKHMLGDSFINRRVWESPAAHAEFLSSGTIVFQESTHKEITRRVMEGAALGRLVLADRPSEGTQYSKLFVEDKEVIWYDSKEDAVDKAKYFLAHPQEALEIGDNARKRVLMHHTCSARVKQLLNVIDSMKMLC